MKKLLTLAFILLSTNAYAYCGIKPFKPVEYCTGKWVAVCYNHEWVWICDGAW